ncbi:MAG TPA: hypothetical protein VFY41_05550 [Nitrososphaeraceae archaeon]|nr:hypothetical protein [Nitrososphaeraceae archaeon]
MPSEIIKTPTPTIISVSLLLAITLVTSLYVVSAYAQNLTQNEENSGRQTLHIIKDATNSYTISSGTSFVSAFDTTYSIIGGVSSIEESKDLLISTIIEDFSDSPTIGYINNTSTSSVSQTSLNQSSLPNPFATKDVIDEKIRNELTASIDDAAKSDSADGEIKCIFGSNLDDFKCSFHR